MHFAITLKKILFIDVIVFIKAYNWVKSCKHVEYFNKNYITCMHRLPRWSNVVFDCKRKRVLYKYTTCLISESNLSIYDKIIQKNLFLAAQIFCFFSSIPSFKKLAN